MFTKSIRHKLLFTSPTQGKGEGGEGEGQKPCKEERDYGGVWVCE